MIRRQCCQQSDCPPTVKTISPPLLVFRILEDWVIPTRQGAGRFLSAQSDPTKRGKKKKSGIFLTNWSNEILYIRISQTKLDIRDRVTLCCGGSPGHYRAFNIIPGLHPPYAKSTTLHSSPQSVGPTHALGLRSLS